jgi:anti-sigma regulatory factor (Ser/Thr protein kinase)
MESAVCLPDPATAILVEHVRLRIPSTLEWIVPTAKYLTQRAVQGGVCDEHGARRVALALHEALVNLVLHGNLEVSAELKERGSEAYVRAVAERSTDPKYAKRTVTIGVHCEADRCQWSFTDQGPGFDYHKVLQRAVDTEALSRPTGRGIFIMRNYMNEVRYEEGGRRVLLTCQRTELMERRQTPLPTVEPAEDDLGHLPAEARRCRASNGLALERGCEHTPAPKKSTVGLQAPIIRGNDVLPGPETRQPLSRDERRGDSRVRYNERIKIYPSENAAVPAYGRNLSRGGVAFVATQGVPLGPAVIALPLPNSTPVCLEASIVRCNKISQVLYEGAARLFRESQEHKVRKP